MVVPASPDEQRTQPSPRAVRPGSRHGSRIGTRMSMCASFALTAAFGCNPPASPGPQEGGTTGAAGLSEPTLREKAHEESFAAMRTLALKALELADPLRLASLDPKAPPRISLADGESRGKREVALGSASREADEIDSSALPLLSRVLLRTTRFALDRARDQLLRHPPEATDPTWKYARVLALIDLLDQRRLRGEKIDHAKVIADLKTDLEALASEERAASLAGLRHAAGRSQQVRMALSLRVDALKGGGSSTQVELAAASLDELSEAITKIEQSATMRADTFETLPQGQWSTDSTGRLGVVFAKLPDAMSRPTLERMLAVEEGIGADVPRLAAEVDAALRRLDALVAATKSNARVASEPQKVTLERCEERWRALQAKVPEAVALQRTAELDCARFVEVETIRARERTPQAPSAPNLPDNFAWYASDDELLLALIDRGLTDISRAASEHACDPLLAMVYSEAGARAQRHLSRISLAHAVGEWGVLDRAAGLARADLCRAGFSLRLHGEMGSAEERVAWLTTNCPDMDATLLMEEVLASPRESVLGLSFALLGVEPFRLTARDLNWWLPHGLLDVVGDPSRALVTSATAPSSAAESEATPMLKPVPLDEDGATQGEEQGAGAVAPKAPEDSPAVGGTD